MKTQAFIGLGGNLGNPRKILADAIEELLTNEGIFFRDVSSLYQTEPIDSDGPDYFNAVLEIDCTLTAEQLLEKLLKTEDKFGRLRPIGIHNAPRTVDLDLLVFGQESRDTEFLRLPHPRLTERAFVLIPLLELNPNIKLDSLGYLHKYVSKVQNQKIKLFKTSSQWLGDKKWLKPSKENP